MLNFLEPGALNIFEGSLLREAKFKGILSKASQEREERERVLVLEALERARDLEAYSRIRSDILSFFVDAHVPSTLDDHFGYKETD